MCGVWLLWSHTLKRQSEVTTDNKYQAECNSNWVSWFLVSCLKLIFKEFDFSMNHSCYRLTHCPIANSWHRQVGYSSKGLQVTGDNGRSVEKEYKFLMFHKYCMECASWLASKYLTGNSNGSVHGVLARRISFHILVSWPGSHINEAPRRLPSFCFVISTGKNCN